MSDNTNLVGFEIARYLLAHPDSHEVCVWRIGDEWGWRAAGDRTTQIPSGAQTLVERIDNGDAEPTDDPTVVAAYAAEIAAWLQTTGLEGDTTESDGIADL